MTNVEAILQLARENDSVVTAEAVQAHGLHRRILTRMVDYGILRRIAVGKYALNPDYHEPPINELARVAFELPEGVACLTTALVLHGFNCVKDSTREIIHYAIPRSKWRSIIPDIFVKYHYFSKTAMTEGIVSFDIDGQIVNVYDIPKTICSSFEISSVWTLPSLRLRKH